MSARLTKLNSVLLDPEERQQQTTSPCSIGTAFSATSNPSLLDRFNIGHQKPNTKIFVEISSGLISIASCDSTAVVAANQVCVELVGKKTVRIRRSKSEQLYTFDNRVLAVEFVGAVQLVQHISALRSSEKAQGLLEQLKNTLEFAEEMWTLALWSKLFPYARLVESLESAVTFVLAGDHNTAFDLLDALHGRFYPHASVHKAIHDDGSVYFQPTHMALLAAKIRAVVVHLGRFTL
ncbi:unnamed protein product [Aphanomyces euteiches]|uniref:Uncharacterized protein n=1 Tax=Aphanomyces euteiches TaxID=100861 RepID=A0A6G0W3Q2_9STRA|nr:hypothetical protein Ae201684_019066 [Aphanomyces euteiches]KAH9089484.1 hypothetical protein Ae201684P_007654 [Aphanomyces euteiches]KAH9139233.1 hypothetical protein AeRB84_016494 [Aphanomyces euteiches]